jgi:hypothetical protein
VRFLGVKAGSKGEEDVEELAHGAESRGRSVGFKHGHDDSEFQWAVGGNRLTSLRVRFFT